ncbi:EAL domain-containing protein [Salipaludibacillus sp. HK11]|uniref:bifunctional diguanylate cyclase/phosphodiesterase n=1 Tax=Salipaludibacillus sp. HK11 TaxID=3394320 RepID=UPI0039FCCF64
MLEQYNYFIVGLSVLIAIVTSVLALSITAKLSYSERKSKIFWLISGSIVMGSGVWSMHFIGMMAFQTHDSVSYNVLITILSMFASVISSFIAFYITMPKVIKWYRIVIGGLIMGSGIVKMHYLGMEAMQMDATLTYDMKLVALSVLIAFIASYAALFLFLRFRNQSSSKWSQGLSGIVMGFAIAGMHYTGMLAANFEMNHAMEHSATTSDNRFLFIGVTLTVFVILLISWGTMQFDRHVLKKLAYQDTITPLPNRNAMRLFFDTYQKNEYIGVLFLDLAQFKSINDTMGHHIGDLLLRNVGSKLDEMSTEDQQAYRIDGDEFVFVIKRCDGIKTIELAKAIINELNQPFFIEGNEIHFTTSIGISFGSIKQAKSTKLLEEAAIAMYNAKELGKNQFVVYSNEMGIVEKRKMELEQDLSQSIKKDQLFLVYQPKVDVNINGIIGVEALIRWKHPKFGVISPGEFIPIAEESEFIFELTEWTLKEACLQCKHWKNQGINLPVAVNLSVKLFKRSNVKNMIAIILDEYRLAPEYLELEVTESIIYTNLEATIDQLNDIKMLGVKLSMDDFGTGYSSISLLDLLPIDTLKLDKSFIQHIENTKKQIIIEGILFIAEKLELKVIAEGIETKKEEELLKKLGCFVMQGYYYSKPISADEIIELCQKK